MSLKEKLIHFWNVTLGEDIQEQEDIETSNNPEYAELKKSLERVKVLEEKVTTSNNGKKGGKGNSGKSKVVETVEIDTSAVAKQEKAQKESTKNDIER